MSQGSAESGISENLQQTLPGFSVKFTEEDDYVKARSLQTYVYTYLSPFKKEQVINLKSKEFLDVLHELSDLCGRFLQPPYTFETQDETVLSSKIQNLESASICFDTIQECLKTFGDKNQGIFVITVALKILSQGYTHCKESDTIYGEVLDQFVVKLGVFFKKNISNLEKIVLQQLDVLGAVKNPEDEFDINSILQEIGNLCQVVSTLEADVSSAFWTSYIKIITNHHKHVKESSGIGLVLTHIVLKILEIIEVCKLSLDKNFEKDDNICSKFSFYFDVLLNLVNFSQSKQEMLHFRTLLLKLYDFLILCYSPFTPDEIDLEGLRFTIKKNAYAVLSYFFSDEAFVKSFLFLDPIELQELQIGHVILMLCALPFTKLLGSSLHEDNLKKIFNSFLLNKEDDDMKLLYVSIPWCTVTKTNSDQLIVLYQFAYEKILEYLKLLPETEYFNLESTMLRCLETSADVTSLLISDVWMHYLRCNSVYFLYHRCESILKKYTLKMHSNYKMQSFIRRALKFLPQSYKKQLFEDFSILQFVIDNSEALHHRYGTPNFSLQESELSKTSAETIEVLLSKLNESSGDVQHLIQRTCSCLELCTLFVNSVGSPEILQFIEFAAHAFKCEVYDVQIAVLTFIKELARKSLPENSSDFTRIISSMAQLFSETIHSKNYIVKFEALHTFNYFAKCTPHVRIVQETVRQDPSLKSVIKSYIAAVPDTGFLIEKEKLEYLELQSSMFKEANLTVSEHSTQSILQQILPKH